MTPDNRKKQQLSMWLGNGKCQIYSMHDTLKMGVLNLKNSWILSEWWEIVEQLVQFVVSIPLKRLFKSP